MRVLLLSPPARYEFAINHMSPPLGLGYIAAFMKRSENEILLKDCFDLGFKGSEDLIKRYNPDIVGISSNTANRHEAFKLAQVSKSVCPDALTVLGGPHVTALPNHVLKNYRDIDVLVRGEGEVTFLEIANNYSKGNKNSLKNIKGISFRKGSKIFNNKDRGLMQNLNCIPFPAWEFFEENLDKYNKKASFQNYDLPKTMIRMKKASIMTSRGCPFNCVFCYSGFWGKNYRARSAENVVDEMEFLRHNYDIRYIRFFDDNFTFSKKRTIEICKQIIRRKLDIVWRCEGRVNNADSETYSWMKRAGCHMIEFGVESGSQKILNNTKKGISVKQIENAFKSAHEQSIKTKALIMIGNPGENYKTVSETLELINNINPTRVVLNTVYVVPNSGLYHEMLKKGKISEDIWLDEDVTLPMYTGEMSEEELRELFSIFYTKMLFNRREIKKLLFESMRKLLSEPKKSLSILKNLF